MADLDELHLRGFELAERALAQKGFEMISHTSRHAIFHVPWREDKHPSLHVLKRKDRGSPPGSWIDRGTDDSGDSLALVARLYNLDVRCNFPEVIRVACRLLGIEYGDRAQASPAQTPIASIGTDQTSEEEKLEAMARQYGQEWCAFVAAGCRTDRRLIRDKDQGISAVLPVISYPIRTADGSQALKYKTRDRYAQRQVVAWPKGKRLCSSKGGCGLFIAGRLEAGEGGSPFVYTAGEEKVLSCQAAGFNSACWSHGEGNAPKGVPLLAHLPSVVVWMDADTPGEEAAEKTCAALLEAGVAEVRKVNWPEGTPPKWDAADVLREQGPEAVRRMIEGAVPFVGVELPHTSKRHHASCRDKIFTAADLAQEELPPETWLVEGLLPETGLAILAGAPKGGKSWWCLLLALAVACGRKVFGEKEGLQTAKAPVLYLALEDHKRRLKTRLETLCSGFGDIPSNVHFATDWPRLEEGGEEELEAWLEDHPDTRLVIADTLGRIRQPTRRSGDVYQEDVEVTSRLQRLAFRTKTLLLATHHTRKQDADDPLGTVSGSYGNTASADVILVLKRGRKSSEGVLTALGRDIEERDIGMTFQDGVWTLVGDAEELMRSDERARIINVLKECGPLGPKEIAAKVGRSPESVRQLVLKMTNSGALDRPKRGLYAVPNSGGSSHESDAPQR